MTEADFRKLVTTQRDRLHTYAAWSLGDLEAAMDACQEAYIRLWQQRHRVHPAAGRAWLFRVMHRLCIDHHRRCAGRRELQDATLVAAPEDNVRTADGCPTDVQRVVADGLARLPSSDRALLVLREIIGMPLPEISQVTGRPVGNVKVALHRARRRLKRELIKVYGQDGP